MLGKNSVLSGLLLGSILPILSWLVFEHSTNIPLIMDKPAVPYLITIGLNLVLLRYCFRNGRDETANGIMMITFAFMLVVFILKINMAR